MGIDAGITAYFNQFGRDENAWMYDDEYGVGITVVLPLLTSVNDFSKTHLVNRLEEFHSSEECGGPVETDGKPNKFFHPGDFSPRDFDKKYSDVFVKSLVPASAFDIEVVADSQDSAGSLDHHPV
jgi:hypothetical protein